MSSQNNILLVEDNPDDRDLTIMALKGSKTANEIDIARDGEEALRYFERFGTSTISPGRSRCWCYWT